MLTQEELSTLSALVAGSVVKFAWLYYLHTKVQKARDTAKVGKIGKILLYPIKGCKAVEVKEAECTPLGLKAGNIVDRHRVIVDNDGFFMTMGNVGKMCLIKVTTSGENLLLEANGMPTLKLPLMPPESAPCIDAKVYVDKLPGRDYGDEAANWLAKFLEVEGCRLLYSAPDLDKRVMNECEKRFFDLARAEDELAYADIASYLVMAQPSVDDLVTRLPQDLNVTHVNFRCNILVDDAIPYSEDDWETMYMGDQACLYKMKLCQRCPKTTVDPNTGKKLDAGEPLKTLRKYRLKETYIFGDKPILGIHSNLLRPGKIRVGDPVYASSMSPKGYLM